MSQIEIWDEGQLSMRCVHVKTGVAIQTDAPKELHGLERGFSPTDLFAAALGSCALTFMAMKAEKLKISLKGSHASVEKTMSQTLPRRISQLVVTIVVPQKFSEAITKELIDAAQNCPVHCSLHPQIEVKWIYHWGEL